MKGWLALLGTVCLAAAADTPPPNPLSDLKKQWNVLLAATDAVSGVVGQLNTKIAGCVSGVWSGSPPSGGTTVVLKNGLNGYSGATSFHT